MQHRRSDTDIGKKNAGQTASWTMRAKAAILIAMIKIPMKNAVAELDGDEMTRVLWQLVKDKLLSPSIGAGCFIAEIQQTSNITYRIYDYNRHADFRGEVERVLKMANGVVLVIDSFKDPQATASNP